MGVTGTVTMRLIVPARPGTLRVGLSYSAADPYAVRMVFTDGGQHNVWVMARKLLATGLTRETGLGQVLVWPMRDMGDVDNVAITLRTGDGIATLAAPIPWLAGFLHDTYTLVPAGTESLRYDIDADLAALLPATGEGPA